MPPGGQRLDVLVGAYIEELEASGLAKQLREESNRVKGASFENMLMLLLGKV